MIQTKILENGVRVIVKRMEGLLSVSMGVLVGTGSACSSKNRYSRVILACGADEATADGVLRLSLSKATTEEECREAAAVVTRCARELRERMR